MEKIIETNTLEELILNKGAYTKEQNEVVYNLYFKDWFKDHRYIYGKFNMDLSKKLLDIGCAYGQNLIHFGKGSVGIDISDEHYGFCSKLGLDVRRLNVEERFYDKFNGEKFDYIWCTDMLIHLTAPYAFLLQCRELLKEDGKLILQIPQYTSLIPQGIKKTYESDCHFYTFNYPTLKYLLQHSGYKVINEAAYTRFFPPQLNFITEWFWKRFGPNLWFCAEKGDITFTNKPGNTFPDNIKELYKVKK